MYVSDPEFTRPFNNNKILDPLEINSTLLGAQMVMTDVTGTRGIFGYEDDDVIILLLFIDRAVAMGRLTVAYGLGMIVGPTLGGWVTMFFSEQYAAGQLGALFAAGVFSVVSNVILLFYN